MPPNLIPINGSQDMCPVSGYQSTTDLSDDELVAGGLVRISVFARTPSSANALRQKNAKERAANKGFKQVNVLAPEAAHTAIRTMAKELQSGRSVRDVLELMLAAEAAAVVPLNINQNLADGSNRSILLIGLTNWFKKMARLLGLS